MTDSTDLLLQPGAPETISGQRYFLIRPVNQFIELASKRPNPNELFGSLLMQGEVVILFSDTNLGKSILAVQIGNSVSHGTPVPGFKYEGGAMNVLYIDCELSDKQFQARYTGDDGSTYRFSEKFFRAEIDADFFSENEVNEDSIIKHIEDAIQQVNAKVVILDNISVLCSRLEEAKSAAPLMMRLKQLTRRLNITLLTLAHTPKRDSTRPITKNDLAGSRRLMDYADSAFALGESQQGSAVRYIKQIKTRSSQEKYGSENIIVCNILKDICFLQLRFVGFDEERNHLKPITDEYRAARVEDAGKMKAQGYSHQRIADHFGVTEGAVRKWLGKKGTNE